MGVSSLYRFLIIALLTITSTLLLHCPYASAGMTMRKLAGSKPRRPPPPRGSIPTRPVFKSPPPPRPPPPPPPSFPPPPPPPPPCSWS